MALDEHMKAKGLTNQALAELLGVDASYVSRLRGGRRRPSIQVAAKLEELTGIPAKAFAGAAQ